MAAVVLAYGVAVIINMRLSWFEGAGSLIISWYAALYFCFVLLAVVSRRDGALRRLLRIRWLGRLGGIAYGVYLIHEAILGLCHWFDGNTEPILRTGRDAATTVIALAITLMLATISFRYFESPLLR